MKETGREGGGDREEREEREGELPEISDILS